MKKIYGHVRGTGGFTMIEIISVLIIIGIVTTVVIVRLNNTRDYDLVSQLEVVKAHLRLAQIRAMSSSSSYGINFNSATTYYLFNADAPATQILIPGENDPTVTLTSKKTSLSISSAPHVISFDSFGSPGSNTITITTNAGNITITKNTGFIP